MLRPLLPDHAVRLLVVGVVLVSLAAGCGGDDDGSRQAEVAARGAEVMPFDLDRTTHVFTATPDGGVQTVVADEPDETQVSLVRAHLREEADRFARGDFGDPARIHGEDMPGLAELRAGHHEISVAYDEVGGGARLTYRTDDAALVDALHRWFDAQVADHGDHAEHGRHGASGHDEGIGR
jgi:hypothetical protein